MEQQASSMGDKIMGISIRNLCWQAHKSIPVTLFKHCLFKMTEKNTLTQIESDWGETEKEYISKEAQKSRIMWCAAL